MASKSLPYGASYFIHNPNVSVGPPNDYSYQWNSAIPLKERNWMGLQTRKCFSTRKLISQMFPTGKLTTRSCGGDGNIFSGLKIKPNLSTVKLNEVYEYHNFNKIVKSSKGALIKMKTSTVKVSNFRHQAEKERLIQDVRNCIVSYILFCSIHNDNDIQMKEEKKDMFIEFMRFRSQDISICEFALSVFKEILECWDEQKRENSFDHELKV